MKEEELTPSKPVESAAAPSKPAPIEGSCHFFVERKKRYCRFRSAKESNFCAEHRTAFQVLKVIAFTFCIMLRNYAFYFVCCLFLDLSLSADFSLEKSVVHVQD